MKDVLSKPKTQVVRAGRQDICRGAIAITRKACAVASFCLFYCEPHSFLYFAWFNEKRESEACL